MKIYCVFDALISLKHLISNNISKYAKAVANSFKIQENYFLPTVNFSYINVNKIIKLRVCFQKQKFLVNKYFSEKVSLCEFFPLFICVNSFV